MASKIRIAISGGGVAGATVLRGFLNYAHLDPHIFESAPAFKEAGVVFGLARNATTALKLISPGTLHCLERAKGVPMQGVRFYIANGKDAGTQVFQYENQDKRKVSTTVVQRADFLHELLADVPEERMHTSKKLERLEHQTDGSILIHFTDMTTHECDIVIGADGIRSTVRKIILEEDGPAAAPRNTGWWGIQELLPYGKARASIGEGPVDINDAHEYGWIGDGAFIAHNILSAGQLVQLIVSMKDNDAEGSDQWQRLVTAGELRNAFIGVGYLPHLEQAIEKLLCSKPEQRPFYLWEHLPARTLVNGPVCVIGDAVHATTPWQGSGGGMCIEDSLILATLLGRASTVKEAHVALKVYDQMRRPRTQQIVETSHRSGEVLTGRYEHTELEVEKLKNFLGPNWDYIIDYNIAKCRDDAIQLIEELLQGA